MNNNLIIHKIVLYVKKHAILRLFMNITEYRSLIKTSNSHLDQLYKIYGIKKWSKVTNLNTAQRLDRLGISFNEEHGFCLVDYLASNGYLDILQWYYDKIYPKMHVSGWTLKLAITKGHLEVVKWLHEKFFFRQEVNVYNYLLNTCPIDIASKYGHLEIIKWYHSYYANRNNNNNICSIWAINWAAEEGHFEIVKWLLENRTEGYSVYAINSAICHGHREIAEWIVRTMINMLVI